MTRPPLIRLHQDKLIIDSFAGGGGASLGIEMGLGRSPDVAINHDADAIRMHALNHPGTRHYRQDLWAVDPREATQGRPVGLMWLSPDCKHFSKAKGGKPVEKKIRGLAWVAVKWAKAVRPDVIVLENVEEFQDWGPLLEDGRPCPLRKGLTFRRFVRQLERCGYRVEYHELVAADYGAPTSRKRLFLIARADGLPIVWPTPTHGRGLAQAWRTAAECIDWSHPCPSIFERVRPLAENTLRRIARGIRKYVIDAAQPFIVPVLHAGDARVHGLDDPLPTVTGAHRGEHALVEPFLVQASHGEGKPGGVQRWGDGVRSLDRPVGTLTGSNDFGLVTAELKTRSEPGFLDEKPGHSLGEETVSDGFQAAFLTEHANGSRQRIFDAQEPLRTQCGEVKGGHFALVAPLLVGAGGPAYSGKPTPADAPLRTQTTENHRAVACATLIQTGYGEREGQQPRVPGIDKPLGTVVAGAAKHALVTAFMAQHNGGYYDASGGAGRQMDLPMSTITQAGSNQAVVASSLVKLKGTSQHGQPLDVPLHTVQAGGFHFAEVRAFLLKYYGTEQDPQLHLPMHTLTARDRFGLVTVQGQDYHIADIGMRMLQPRELFRAQGFPDSYKIEADTEGLPFTKSAQVRMCGNSVCPPVAAAIVRAQFGIAAEEVAA